MKFNAYLLHNFIPQKSDIFRHLMIEHEFFCICFGRLEIFTNHYVSKIRKINKFEYVFESHSSPYFPFLNENPN